MAANEAGKLFPTNPDFADMLGNTDFDFDNLYFGEGIPDFQISGFPD